MTQPEQDDEDLKRLLPYPFCGEGVTIFVNNGTIWNGTKKSIPVSVSIRHWCNESIGPNRMIERVGSDREQAIMKWNTRKFTN
jgi:hypothetical protein